MKKYKCLMDIPFFDKWSIYTATWTEEWYNANYNIHYYEFPKYFQEVKEPKIFKVWDYVKTITKSCSSDYNNQSNLPIWSIFKIREVNELIADNAWYRHTYWKSTWVLASDLVLATQEEIEKYEKDNKSKPRWKVWDYVSTTSWSHLIKISNIYLWTEYYLYDWYREEDLRDPTLEELQLYFR